MRKKRNEGGGQKTRRVPNTVCKSQNLYRSVVIFPFLLKLFQHICAHFFHQVLAFRGCDQIWIHAHLKTFFEAAKTTLKEIKALFLLYALLLTFMHAAHLAKFALGQSLLENNCPAKKLFASLKIEINGTGLYSAGGWGGGESLNSEGGGIFKKKFSY
jgi:hypothetical protein